MTSHPEPISTTTEMVTDLDNKFNDEPKGANTPTTEPEDPVFVEDIGDGTTTLMKPLKPTIHRRARDSHFNIDGNRISNKDSLEEIDDSVMTVDDYKSIKAYIVSNALFVFGSMLYLAMACMIIDYYWWYRDTPRHVYWADDDATWWNYFVNCTDDAFFPVNVTNADDDYTWMEWYNYSAFPEDDIVWLPGIADQEAPWPESYVSKYMIVYFLAALSFVFTGVIESILARNSPFWIRAISYTMILAALFGVASATLTNKNPLWSNICNCISVNLWAIESLIIVLGRVKGVSELIEVTDDESTQLFFGLSISTWIWVADISFMLGTWGDAITSYFYLFQYDNFPLGVLAIVFAACWLLCSFIYFAFSIHDFLQWKSYMYLAAEFENERKELEAKGIIVEAVGYNVNGARKPDGAGVEQAPLEQAPQVDDVSVEEAL